MALCQKSSESNLGMFLGNQRSTRWGCSSERAAISWATVARKAIKSLLTLEGDEGAH